MRKDNVVQLFKPKAVNFDPVYGDEDEDISDDENGIAYVTREIIADLKHAAQKRAGLLPSQKGK